MRFFKPVLFLLVFCSQTSLFASNRYIIQIPFSQKNLRKLQLNQFDIPGVNLKRGTADVLISDETIEKFKTLGIPYKTLKKREPLLDETTLDQRYLNPQKVQQKLIALHEAFPQKTLLKEIGKSLRGQPIFALLVSSTPNLESVEYYKKPSMLVDGMHHAREIMTPEIVVDIAEVLLRGAQVENTRVLEFLREWNVWLVPMVNVDGNQIVWTKDNWWRKNARGAGGKVWGVDINRNYPFLFGQCDGSSASRSAQDFHGDSPASEPETQALLGLAEFVQPTVYLSYHSYSEIILFPFGCAREITSEDSYYRKVSADLAQYLPTDAGNGFYNFGTPWELLYSVDGDSMNTMYARYGAFSLTIEVNQEFQPSYDLRAPTLRKNRIAWQRLIDTLDQNILTISAKDSNGNPVQAFIDLDRIQIRPGALRLHTNKAGYFFKSLEPGNYQVRVSSVTGESKLFTVTMKGKAEVLDVQF
jgi:carboxypeptidase T